MKSKDLNQPLPLNYGQIKDLLGGTNIIYRINSTL